jgi:phosphoribosylglycinamide formyltransferase-1
VLVSGRGTNLGAILDQCNSGWVDAEVRVVIANRPNSGGLDLARAWGVPAQCCPRSSYPDRGTQQDAIKEELLGRGVELVVLAGFDQILGTPFMAAFPDRIVNLHPSLLPAFAGGLHAVRDALAYGVKIAGCTVHFVSAEIEEIDGGPIILQEAVPVLDDDDEETLLARIHEAEHRVLPRAIQLIAEGRVRVEGRRTRILPAP